MRAGDSLAARDAFERLLQLEPWNVQAHLGLGLLSGRAGDPAALTHFQQAIAYDARSASGYYHLGVTYLGLEPPRWAAALRHLRRAQRLGYAVDARLLADVAAHVRERP